jgi:hypothetical protein
VAEVGGVRAHVARLRRIAGAALRDRAGEAVMTAARAIEAEAGALAGDGSLAAGIVAERTGPASAEVRSTTPHAVVVEYGSSKRAERPYMRAAAARQRAATVADIARAVQSVVRGGS